MRTQLICALTLSLCLISELAAWAHCGAYFVPNRSAALEYEVAVYPETAAARQKQAVENIKTTLAQSTGDLGHIAAGAKSVADFISGLNNTPQQKRKLAFESNPHVMGYRNSASNYMVLFKDSYGNIIGIKSQHGPTGEYEFLSPLNLPGEFDLIFEQELPPSKDFFSAKLIPLPDGGLTIGYYDKSERSPHFALSKAEVDKIENGESLGLDENVNFATAIEKLQKGRKPFVAWSSPLMIPTRGDIKVLRFLEGLQRAYPGLTVALDDPNPSLDKKVKALENCCLRPEAEQMRTIFIRDRRETRTDEVGVIQPMIGIITNAGMEIIDFTEKSVYKGGKGRGVVVLTAHSEPELLKFIAALGAAKFLEGNIVVIQSCRTPINQQVLDLILKQYGATAALGCLNYPEAQQMKLFVDMFAAEYKKSSATTRLVEIIQKCLRVSKIAGLWRLCFVQNEEHLYC